MATPLASSSPEAQPAGASPVILVTFALRAESGPFRRLVGAGTDLAIIETGIGQGRTRAVLEKALTMLRPRWVITSGYAGALNPKLAAGTIVFDADEGWPLTSRLRASGALAARFHCAERIAVTASEKKNLWDATGADAIEMESQAIRGLCRERGIPGATVRVISDAAGEDLPLDFNQLLTPELALSYGKLVRALARSPGKIVDLVRFQRRVQAAARKLGQTLATLIADRSVWPR